MIDTAELPLSIAANASQLADELAIPELRSMEPPITSPEELAQAVAEMVWAEARRGVLLELAQTFRSITYVSAEDEQTRHRVADFIEGMAK